MKKVQENEYLLRDLAIVVLSIIIAVLMVKIGVLKNLFTATQEFAILGSFLAGIFFTSAFTIAPASIILAELAGHHSPYVVALCGAAGAMVGDLIIFLFIRDRVSRDISYILKKIKFEKLLSLFHLGFLRVLSPFIGALIIASPLPDELGIAMMGMSKMKTYVLIPVAFLMNFLGILGIATLASIL
ncbi:MAG: hypothetical protein M3Q63_02855 [bacterium]|nr:hypothetical protein [bacterium]